MQTVITYYKDLSRWDIKSYLWRLKSPFQVEPLGKYIYEHSEKVNIFKENEKEFPILGVTNKEGVYLNAYVKGKNINQSYKKVKGGELTYNPYRVNVGSIGIVQNEYDGFYISPAYVVFGTKEGLLNEYLYFVLSSEWFNPYLRAATSGSVRQNLTYNLLSDLHVPIPPLEVQERIVEKWHMLKINYNKINQYIEKRKRDIEDCLKKDLDIKNNQYKKTNGAFIVCFKEIERWGVNYNDYYKQGILSLFSSFTIVDFNSVVMKCQYGTSEKANLKVGYPVLRMKNIVNGYLNIDELKYIKLRKKDFESLRLKKGDILFNRTNSKELVGKTAIFDLDGDYVFASYLIRVKLNPDKVIPEFVNFLFNSQIVKNQINAISRQIIGQANINTVELGNIKIPLPPLKKQKQIVAKLSLIIDEINNLRKKEIKLLKNTKEKIRHFLVK